MTHTAPRATESSREFAIHSGRRVVSTQYSFSALQAAIDHVRSLVHRRTRSRFSGMTQSHGGGLVTSLFPFSHPAPSPKKTRVTDGKISSIRIYYDQIEVLTLGLMPGASSS